MGKKKITILVIEIMIFLLPALWMVWGSLLGIVSVDTGQSISGSMLFFIGIILLVLTLAVLDDE